jgi:hypothetical protein
MQREYAAPCTLLDEKCTPPNPFSTLSFCNTSNINKGIKVDKFISYLTCNNFASIKNNRLILFRQVFALIIRRKFNYVAWEKCGVS